MRHLLFTATFSVFTLITFGQFSLNLANGHLINSNEPYNVGIGLNSPSAKLHLRTALLKDELSGSSDDPCLGNVAFKITADLPDMMMMPENCIAGNIIEAEREINFLSGAVTDRVLVLNAEGKLGIGSNITPTESLDVDGRIRMRQGAKNGYVLVSDALGTMKWVDPYHGLNLNWSRKGDHVYNTNPGSVSIGTQIQPSPGYLLNVGGKVICEELKVLLYKDWDAVFQDDYHLLTIEEVDEFVTKNKHLPWIDKGVNYRTNGINLSEMNGLLLRKIEELTLYVIQLNDRIKELETE